MREAFMPRILALAAALAVTLSGAAAHAASPSLRPDQAAFRDLYKELVETDTTYSGGSCTLAAERMAKRLADAGFPQRDLHLFTAPGHPKEGGLVAVLPGRDAKAKAVLLLAHIDVVEAKREDWTRDPFRLVEEGGYFFGRGTIDDKAMAAIGVDSLIRFKRAGYQPRRTLKVALTCGEESSGALNGAQYLVEHRRDLIDAAFAINEGGAGRLDRAGKPIMMALQVGEKLSQNYQLETTDPGGHSSRPTPSNAIYRLAHALERVEAYRFPIAFNDTTRDFFARMAKIRGGEEGEAMRALLANPEDAAARAVLERNLDYNAMLHTTCVATMLDAGHASNALPQRARATLNCRIFPGSSGEDVRRVLEQAIGDPRVKVTMPEVRNAPSPAPPLDPKVLGPAEDLARRFWPGVPQVRQLSTAATDGAFLTPAGIPTYGITGMYVDPDGSGAHGLDERIRVKVLYDSRDYLYRLLRIYGDQAG
jgi:acetylornithine deacetylase/succinyl-diaminopimelate desuccinylase-like protein